MQSIYTKKIKRIDKKYFHKTLYSMAWDIDLLHNKTQFDIAYYTFKTLIEFNNLLSYYQLSKDKTNKAIEMFENCKTHINSKYEKCYEKHCVEIYEYLMNCYDEILEYKKLGKKPNWNYFVKTITTYIDDIRTIDLFRIETETKIKEIKETGYIYYAIKNEMTFDETLHIKSSFRNKYYKILKKDLELQEIIFIRHFLCLICKIYDLLYNNTNSKNINLFEKTYIDKEFLKYIETSEKGKQFINNYNKLINNYPNTIIELLNAFFEEYPNPISSNNLFIDSYNMLKIVLNSVEENNIHFAKIIIKELLSKHKDFLEEEKI